MTATSAEAVERLTLDTPIKFLAADGSAPFGRGRWHLPHGGSPGAWMRQYKTPPILCERGYHYTTIRHAMEHASERMFLIEPAGAVIHAATKSVAQGGRLLSEITTWNSRTRRLFAADCAERVLHLCGDDPRPRAAIETARSYARGDAAQKELAAARDAARAAARDAARDAAWAAAGDAARRAAWAAARRAAWAAAGDAARDAAWAAARDAARDTAWAAEREWQGARLLAYLTGDAA